MSFETSSFYYVMVALELFTDTSGGHSVMFMAEVTVLLYKFQSLSFSESFMLHI